MLLYIVEAAIPILTWLFFWAGILALKKNKEKHAKIATIHAVSVWGSYLVVWILILMGQSLKGNAPRWIVDTHLVIIYIIPALLVFMMISGRKGVRKVHIPLAVTYTILWAAALVTGAMIFLAHRGYM